MHHLSLPHTRNETSLRERVRKLDSKREMLEMCLDVLHVRLLTPCIGVGFFVTLVLTALRLDGASWPAWYVLLPLWIMTTVGVLALASAIYIYHQRRNPSSVFFGTYDSAEGSMVIYVMNALLTKPNPKIPLVTSGIFLALGK